ncbi:MFS general substrate transporter [Gigaspora margarita]|uniref:MFS general substrate transporter n=1 Tax=Gigaspora margarita TaxID=4874 RepID=A0A8H3XBI8_GIGMA|nr:MFS general substrate transporter [Gigaspora margarita]
MGIAPIVWAAYSDEFATRRKVYLVSITVFIISTIICAVAGNIWLLLVMRVVQACGLSAVLSIGAGIISDIYVSIESRIRFILFGLLVWPISRSNVWWLPYRVSRLEMMFWFLAIYDSIVFLIIIFFLPETFRTVSSPIGTSFTTRFNPIAPLKLLRHPNVILVIIYTSILSSIIHIQYISVPRNFSQRYNLPSSTVGLLFVAPAVGCAFGSLLGGKYSDFVLRKKKAEKGGFSYPEMRIHSAWGGALLVPSSYLIYGWLLEKNFNLIVLMILWFLGKFTRNIDSFQFDFYILDGCIPDAYPMRSASALNNCIRFIASGTVAILEPLMEDALAVYFKGKEWRENMTPNLEVGKV